MCGADTEFGIIEAAKKFEAGLKGLYNGMVLTVEKKAGTYRQCQSFALLAV